MKNFKYKEYNYIILETENYNDESNYQLIKTTKTIVKLFFAYLPIWKNGKFKWLKNCKVRYRLYFQRVKHFDDGWSYSFYWSKWEPKFRLEAIID